MGEKQAPGGERCRYGGCQGYMDLGVREMQFVIGGHYKTKRYHWLRQDFCI